MEEALLWGGGAFANWKVRELHQVKAKLNQTGYHNILQNHIIPLGMWFVHQEFVLMQDNDPKHSSKLCQWHIKRKEVQHVLQLMSWSVVLADLNPIKLVWDCSFRVDDLPECWIRD